jgi:hypothetical protein
MQTEEADVEATKWPQAIKGSQVFGLPHPKEIQEPEAREIHLQGRALDILGADAHPAVRKFTIRKPRHKRR